MRHTRLHGDSSSYCGHPRQCGLFNFGGGELAVLHYHAPSAYREPQDVRHDFGGYHGRAMVLLQRSLDGGATWPREHDVQVWNEAAPVQDRIHLLFSSLRSPREEIDLTHPDAAYHLGRTFLG
ncbi:MAG: sialidase family protein, partial [Candidatus Aminicenantes bacterium]|nr:sialidase family protein [Candidatus Aminicenantes bacterium]